MVSSSVKSSVHVVVRYPALKKNATTTADKHTHTHTHGIPDCCAEYDNDDDKAEKELRFGLLCCNGTRREILTGRLCGISNGVDSLEDTNPGLCEVSGDIAKCAESRERRFSS